eukprot:jgi/Tetstr1/442515/TSEL_030613.t1
MDLPEEELQSLYSWVDEIPLSRAKRNISRDFSDGVLMAELMYHYFPKLVELHNYSPANGFAQKMYNWNTLNQRVFKRLGFQVPRSDCEKVAKASAGVVERVLLLVRSKIADYHGKKKQNSDLGDRVHPPAKPYTGAEKYGAVAPPPPPQLRHEVHAPPGGSPPHWQQPAPGPPLHVPAAPEDGAATRKALAGKDATILELRETSEILETKVRKLEQLVRLKDAKIQTLLAKLQAAGLA